MIHRLKMCTAAAAALAVLAGCGQAGQPAQQGGEFADREQRIPAVEAVEVVRGRLPLEQRLAGSVRAYNQTEIFPQVSAPIVEVFVNDGQFVEVGDPLVQLEATGVEERLRQAEAGLKIAEARVQQAEANLTRVQATLRRSEAMAERDLISAAELETAQADALSAEADLALMQAELEQARSLIGERREELSEMTVKAPISGVVGSRNAEVGQLANTGEALFVIGDTEEMRVNVSLTQQMLRDIEVGTSVNIFPNPESDETIRASITRISPFLHPITRTTTAEIDVVDEDDRLRPGMFVTVDVLYGESELAALVPNSAIYTHPSDGRLGVYATSLRSTGMGPEDPRAGALPALRSGMEPAGPVPVSFVPVEVVARGRLTSAIEGVQPGEWVVTLGHHLLSTSDSGQAIIQPTPWDHIMRLQQMQTRDLLNIIREKQNELSVPESLN